MALIRYKYNGEEKVSTDITVDTTVDRSRFIQNSGDVRLVIDVIGDQPGKRTIGEDVKITLIDGDTGVVSNSKNSNGVFELTKFNTSEGVMDGNLEIVYLLKSGKKLVKKCKFES